MRATMLTLHQNPCHPSHCGSSPLHLQPPVRPGMPTEVLLDNTCESLPALACWLFPSGLCAVMEPDPPDAQGSPQRADDNGADHHRTDRWDADSAFGSIDDDGSIVTSLKSHAMAYQHENGRTYHAYRQGSMLSRGSPVYHAD